MNQYVLIDITARTHPIVDRSGKMMEDRSVINSNRRPVCKSEMKDITETIDSNDIGDTRKRKPVVQYIPEKRKIDGHRKTKKNRSSGTESPSILCIIDSSDEEDVSVEDGYDYPPPHPHS